MAYHVNQEKQFVPLKSTPYHLKAVHKHLKKIYTWEDEEKKQGALTFLDRVFGNIINNPGVEKYRDMNIGKIRKITKKWNSLPLLVFFSAGFEEDMLIKPPRMKLTDRNFEQFTQVQELLENCKLFDPTQEPVKAPAPVPVAVVSEPVVCEETETDAVMAETKPVATEASTNDNAMDVDPPVTENKETTMAEEKVVEKINWDEYMDDDGGDLLAQLKAQKAAKGMEMLNMKELEGLSKEEKVALLNEKRAKFRAAKMQAEIDEAKEKATNERKDIKGAAHLAREREDWQNKMAIERKKREKARNKKRKADAREKIRKQKEQRKLEAESRRRAKEANGSA